MHPDFCADGLLRVPGAIDPSTVGALRDRFWEEVGARFGIQADKPTTWFADPNNPAGDARGRRLSGMNPTMLSLRDSGALTEPEAALQRAVDANLGPARWTPKPMWYSLLSFPTGQVSWTVPRRSWHADEPVVAGESRPWTVFVFVFLAEVRPGGGGTLVVTGAQRCAQRLARRIGRPDPTLLGAFADDNEGLVDPATARVVSPLDVMARLGEADPWFHELGAGSGDPTHTEAERAARYLELGGECEGVPVKVVEITGAPGDVVLMDPRCLHSVSANVTALPREILRLDFRRGS